MKWRLLWIIDITLDILTWVSLLDNPVWSPGTTLWSSPLRTECALPGSPGQSTRYKAGSDYYCLRRRRGMLMKYDLGLGLGLGLYTGNVTTWTIPRCYPGLWDLVCSLPLEFVPTIQFFVYPGQFLMRSSRPHCCGPDWQRLARWQKSFSSALTEVFEQFISIFTSQLSESDILMRPDSLSVMEDTPEDREEDTWILIGPQNLFWSYLWLIFTVGWIIYL